MVGNREAVESQFAGERLRADKKRSEEVPEADYSGSYYSKKLLRLFSILQAPGRLG